MKKFTLLFIAINLIAVYSLNAQNGVSINNDGSSADPSAMLDVKSTTKGFLPPRLSTIELLNIPTPAEGLMVYNTTSKTLNVFNGVKWFDMMGNEVVPVEIGDFIQGGVVFYLDGSGGGFICAVSDQSSGAQWGCHGTPIPGAGGKAIGTGAQNTIDIVAGCGTDGIAADICAKLSLNGYDDWFLPSQDELNEMYQNKAAIDATAIANGGAAFGGTYYWSSSEFAASNAYRQNFASGAQEISGKLYLYSVRAVRAF